MRFEELKSHISRAEFRSIYILMGDDDYLISSARNQFISLVSNKEFNYSLIPSDKPELVVNALNVYPFMSDYSVIDIACDKMIPGLEKYLENPNPKSILLLTLTKLEKYHKELLPKSELIDCNRLGEASLVRWVRTKTQSLNCGIEDRAAELMVSYCNRYMSLIAKETEKLASYAYGRTVTVDDVETLVTRDADVQVFQLGDAVAKKDAKKAFEIYKELSASNDETMIFGVLYSHFRKLLYCALSPNGDLVASLGMKEFVVKKMIAQSKVFGAVRLKSIIDGFHEIDYGMKNGTFTDKSVMESYLLKILNL